jgi:hypothetical protein
MSELTPIIDPVLYQFATDRQAEYLRAIEKHNGNQTRAAKDFGVNPQVVHMALKSVRVKATKRGWSPDHDMTAIAPEGYAIKGTSTLYDDEGKVKIQWVKTQVDLEKQLEIVQQVIRSMCDTMPRLEAMPPPIETNTDLLNVYTMTDCHMGMLAWKKETGAAWDLEIGERVLTACFAAMLNSSPAADQCVVAQLGDFLHYDGMEAITPTSGHILDADSRFGKLVAVAARCLRNLVDMALAKHATVYVLMAEGNHDMASSVWLRTMFSMLYENEPRVQMIESENPYYTMQFGKTMLGWHHGHKKGLDPSTGLMFATRNPKMFGDTEHRYIHFGDKHHWAGKEVAGFYLEQHPTLASADAYAARGGWDSNSRACAIVYHREHGEAARYTVNPGMVGLAQ